MTTNTSVEKSTILCEYKEGEPNLTGFGYRTAGKIGLHQPYVKRYLDKQPAHLKGQFYQASWTAGHIHMNKNPTVHAFPAIARAFTINMQI